MKEKVKKKRKILVILGCLLTICLVTGISYAYWVITKKQEGLNKVSSGCFNIELSNEKNDIKLENAYPITDEEGRKLVPYSFTVTNTCSLFASYNINLEMLEGTTLASKYIKVMVNNEEIKNLADLETTNIVLSNSVESRKLTSGILGSGDSEEYTVRIWMDGSITASDKEAMNKVMLSKVVVDASVSKYSPVNSGITLLKDAILANEYQTTDIELAKAKIANKQAVDFCKTAPIIDWEESHNSSTTTLTTALPDPSLIGTGVLNNDNVFPLIGTDYTFNSETGFYSLVNAHYVDPTTLNYDSKNYYYCESGISTGTSGFYIGSARMCIDMKKIVGATKSKTTITTLTGTSYDAVTYKMVVIYYKQTEIESDKSDKGLYPIEDYNGTSYYYRGSVNNNYVLFGGHYFRIIRINGDGSIRLLYAGTKKDAQGEELFSTLTDSSLGLTNAKKVAFNIKKDNPTYVGYMYGNRLNSSYSETIANENDSEIKKYLDSWYRQNIEEKGYSKYIADSGFCNDRSLSSGDGVSTSASTNYGSYARMRTGKVTTLMCPNENDLFTVSNTSGNNVLTYPIGLITVDELLLSGIAKNYINKLTYTYSNEEYWSMSSGQFWQEVARVVSLMSDGRFGDGRYATENFGVRPVINLKADTEISGGIGTANEPFIVK